MMVAKLMPDFSRLGLAWSGGVGGDVDAAIDDDDVRCFQLGWVTLSMMSVDIDVGTGTSRLTWHK